METPPTPTTDSRLALLHRIDALLRQVAGTQHIEDAPTVRELLRISAVCGAAYGIAMGLYAASMRGWSGAAQMLAAALKVPLLFALTIAVTFPSFYVLSAVRGRATTARHLLRVQLVGVALATALLASLGPVTVFFTLSTESHAFMVVLNAVFFAVAGALGLRAVWSRGRLLLRGDRADAAGGLGLLRAWFGIALVVGVQSAWILRPLIGRPEDGFAWFEPRGSNAFAGFVRILRDAAR